MNEAPAVLPYWYVKQVCSIFLHQFHLSHCICSLQIWFVVSIASSVSRLHITPPHLSHKTRIHFYPLGSIRIPIKSHVNTRIIQEHVFCVKPTCKERIHADVLPGGQSTPQPMSACLRPPVSSILSWLAGPALSPAAHPPQAELATLYCDTWCQHKFYICSIFMEEQNYTITSPVLCAKFAVTSTLHTVGVRLYAMNSPS